MKAASPQIARPLWRSSLLRAFVVGAALLGLSGCVYAPTPYAYGPSYYTGYSAYPGYYYAPSVQFYGGGGYYGGWHRWH